MSMTAVAGDLEWSFEQAKDAISVDLVDQNHRFQLSVYLPLSYASERELLRVTVEDREPAPLLCVEGRGQLPFKRTLPLPPTVDAGAVSSGLTDVGILHLYLPKVRLVEVESGRRVNAEHARAVRQKMFEVQVVHAPPADPAELDSLVANAHLLADWRRAQRIRDLKARLAEHDEHVAAVASTGAEAAGALAADISDKQLRASSSREEYLAGRRERARSTDHTAEVRQRAAENLELLKEEHKSRTESAQARREAILEELQLRQRVHMAHVSGVKASQGEQSRQLKEELLAKEAEARERQAKAVAERQAKGAQEAEKAAKTVEKHKATKEEEHAQKLAKEAEARERQAKAVAEKQAKGAQEAEKAAKVAAAASLSQQQSAEEAKAKIAAKDAAAAERRESGRKKQ